MTTLELKLFEDLEEAQQREAAGVIASIEKVESGESRRVDPNQVTEDIIAGKLEDLVYSVESNVVITGIYAGKVVAVYEMPLFRRTGKNSLENRDPGYLTAYPPEQGFGSMVIKSMEQILEAVAHSTQSNGLVHYEFSRSKTLFPRFGYKHERNSNRYHRRYKPKNHPLGMSEGRIVMGFVNAIPFYSEPQQNTSQQHYNPVLTSPVR